MEYYPFLKWVHILSATLLFGTGLGTAFHLWRAHRTGDTRIIAAAARATVLADFVFTAPAVILQPITGALLIGLGGYRWTEPWVVASVILYVVTGACWLPVVWLQIRMHELAAAACKHKGPLTTLYHRYFSVWFILGWPAFLSVLAIFFLMVFKPPFT